METKEKRVKVGITVKMGKMETKVMLGMRDQ
jgi:hypothetical protein